MQKKKKKNDAVWHGEFKLHKNEMNKSHPTPSWLQGHTYTSTCLLIPSVTQLCWLKCSGEEEPKIHLVLEGEITRPGYSTPYSSVGGPNIKVARQELKEDTYSSLLLQSTQVKF